MQTNAAKFEEPTNRDILTITEMSFSREESQVSCHILSQRNKTI